MNDKDKLKKCPDPKYLLKYGLNLLKYPFWEDKKIFQEIYRKNIWGNPETVSGHGSTLHQTAILLKALPDLFEKYRINSILDIPCGDFYWMKELDKSSIDYIGADIVDEIISTNLEKYSGHGRFMVLDICSSPLPEADLILCRDCLVHLSYAKIIKALENISESEIKYLLMTHFPECRCNFNTVTGSWRPLNFTKKPFTFPEPLEIIFEKPLYRAEKYKDKALALWDIQMIKELFKTKKKKG
jgi:SAM-dependent methyltransferase